MGTELIDPQTIRNVTVVGEPDDTTRVVHRLRRAMATAVPPAWTTGHTIRFAEVSTHAPIATLERSIRLADGLLAVMNATTSTARLEAALRVADDHQVARLCLVTGLDQPGADFDRCIHTIAGTHGAVPLVLHIPHGLGAHFDGVVDLMSMWAIEPVAAAYYGRRWELAQQWYRRLREAVLPSGAALTDADAPDVSADVLHDRVRRLTQIGDAVPVLCDATPRGEVAPLVNAIVRYLPSPLQVCQPEHALDY
ncbi:hypothetical protein IU409_17915 [Nocardia cyriacigeorgica]|uniref:hypothetical protein n=1 Tax=Nocardia cyriacigeorgica TaxID=135487 RepID=UPI001892F869|nr:hypothetical protein [Nocardia cyriacigeorgica]MBF6345368.1 hypothetical protein [Nocardia cyriacigeorgica]